ncbi:MAG TPA: hypothetical protein VF746_14360 [Longimicrobium sp.]|jgi:hypothetical protein
MLLRPPGARPPRSRAAHLPARCRRLAAAPLALAWLLLPRAAGAQAPDTAAARETPAPAAAADTLRAPPPPAALPSAAEAALPPLPGPRVPAARLPAGAKPPQLPLPRFEVGVNVGAASTSEFYAGDSPGTGLTVGASAGYWFTPMLGVRLSAAYFGGSLPLVTAADSGSLDVHSLSAALELRVRPLATLRSPVLSSAALSAGVGILSTSFAGDSGSVQAGDDECVLDFESLRAGACLRDGTSSVQLTTGLSVDLVPLGAWSLYAEADLHVYRPAAEDLEDGQFTRGSATGARYTVAATQPGGGASGTALTGRLVAGVRRFFGGGGAAPEAPPARMAEPTNVDAPGMGAGAAARVHVRSGGVEAEVYLVPTTAVALDPNVYCTLRPDPLNQYFKGYTPVTVTGTSQPYVLVVRRGGRERRIPLELVRGMEVPQDVDLSQNTVETCRR